jgi:hypothetical protein
LQFKQRTIEGCVPLCIFHHWTTLSLSLSLLNLLSQTKEVVWKYSAHRWRQSKKQDEIIHENKCTLTHPLWLNVTIGNLKAISASHQL